jgi:hypothetical protein
MSEIKVNKISPATGTETTLGDASDKFIVPSGAELEVASGATITNSGTATNFGGGADMVRIATTAVSSAVAHVDMTDCFTSAYNIYKLYIYDLRAAGSTALATKWQFLDNADAPLTGSSYHTHHIGNRHSTITSYTHYVQNYYTTAVWIGGGWSGHQHSNDAHSAEYTIFNPLSDLCFPSWLGKSVDRNHSYGYGYESCGGEYRATPPSPTAITGIRISGGGTHTFDRATIIIYGIKHA